MPPQSVKSYRNTAVGLIISVAILFILLLLISFWLEPFRGDLTRISGLPDNEYGWRSDQYDFPELLFDTLEHPDLAEKSYEIVVLGDSFSNYLEQSWLNYVVQATGFSAVHYHTGVFLPSEVFESELYQQSPPKLFIYEAVERSMYSLAPYMKEACISDEDLSSLKTFYSFTPQSPADLRKRFIPQPQPGRLDAPMRYLANKVEGQTQTKLATLSQKTLFSSRRPSTLLYYWEDLEKFKLSAQQRQDARCGLKDLQHSVQSQPGETNFLVLVAPDKSSIYADYIVDEGNYQLDIRPLIAPPLNTINLHNLLRQQVKAGIEDVYLPNDTHWGTAGYVQVAEAVIDFLKP
ncbi:MAG: hypothetical protein AAFO84_05595 [Cyanobacteria bacterium J06598_1]